MINFGTEESGSPKSGSGPDKRKFSKAVIEAVNAFVQQFGATLSVLKLYPSGHGAVRPAREDLYQKLKSFLDVESPLLIGISQEQIMLQGQYPIPASLMVDRCVNFFHQLGIAVITFRVPLTQNDFDNFLDYLIERNKRIVPDDLPEESDFPGISISLVNYSRVLGVSQLGKNGGISPADDREKMWQILMADFLLGKKKSLSEKEMLNIISLIEDDEVFSRTVTAALSLEQGPAAAADLAGLLDSAKHFFVGKLGLGEEEYILKIKKCLMSLTKEIKLQLLEVPEKHPEKGEAIRLVSQTLSQEEIIELLASFFEVTDGSTKRLSSLFSLLLNDDASKKEILPALKKNIEGIDTISRQQWLEMEKLLSSSSTEFVSESYSRQLEDISLGEKKEAAMEDEDIQDMIAFTESLHADNLAADILGVLLEIFFLTEEETFREQLLRDLGKIIRNHLLDGRYHLAVEALFFIRQNLGSGDVNLPEKSLSLIKSTLDEILGEEILKVMLGYVKEANTADLSIIKQILSMVPEAAVKVLVPALAEEEDYIVRRFLVSALIDLGHSSKDEALKMLDDKRWYVVRNILTFMGELQDPTTLPRIVPLLKHNEMKVRMEAVRALMTIGSARAREALFIALDDNNEEIVQLVSDYLGSTADRKSLTRILLEWAGQSNPFGFKDGQVKRAILILGKLRANEAVATLERMLMKRRWLVSAKRRYDLAAAAAKALYNIDDPASLRALKIGAEKGRRPVAEICRQLLGKRQE